MLDKREKIALYRVLARLKSDELGNIIKHLDDNSVDAICECVYNVVHSDLKLSPKAKQTLKKKLKNGCSKKNLYIIMKKKNALSKRRKALSQEGSGIGLILATVAPLLANLLFGKKNTK